MVTQEELEQMSPEEIAELQRQNCIFCKIIKGDVPGHEVFDSENTKAILDINPAKKGHVLVMPKDHVPILPLLPPEQFTALFKEVKRVAQGVKKGTQSTRASVFIANGPAAGQQASHFLLHVIARDDGDALSQKFTFPTSPAHAQTQQGLIEPLKQNLPIMLRNHFKRMGGVPFPEKEQTAAPQPAQQTPQAQQTPRETTQTPENQERLQPSENQQEKIVAFFDMYPQAREVLENDVEQFTQLLQKVQPEVKELFAGIHLETLSKQLQQIPKKETPPESPQMSAADIFQGENPQQQAHDIVKYFMEKPKAKELLQENAQSFKELLARRPDVQPLFADVDIEKLALVLDKLLEGVGK